MDGRVSPKMPLAPWGRCLHSPRPFFKLMAILAFSLIGITTKLLLAVNVVVCLLLIFVVLLQRPKNEGLGAAFGGDTASNIFGAQTTNVLANLTRWLAGIFMVITLVLSILYAKDGESKSASQKYIEDAREKKKADEARAKAEAAAKSALDASKAPVPATVTTPVEAPAPAAPGTPAPAAPVTPTAPAAPAPTAPVTPTAPEAAPTTPAPATPEAAPATPPPATPAPVPVPAPEPAKPVGG
jgi:preprotein translocase subunit SecG